MEQQIHYFSRNKFIFLTLLIGLFFGNSAFADTTQLKNIEVSSLMPNKIQIILEFSDKINAPQSFSVENPSAIVFDFPNVTNGLSKELSSQKIGIGVLKNVNVVESEKKTRMILDLSRVVPFETKMEGNSIKIILETGGEAKPAKRVDVEGLENINHITAFDFRRGDHGEGKIIINLSDPKATIDLKDESGKIIANFLGADIDAQLAKRYDVTDFATPVQSVVISQNGQNVNMMIESSGNYDKIAYQMDNQYVIEVKATNKDEKTNVKDLSGEFSGERISLNFQDIEVRAVLQIIADFAGFNVITSDSVKGNITLRLQNVPWNQALDIILKTKGLDKRQFGNVVLIGPTAEIIAREKAEMEGQKLVEELGPLKSELIQIKYAKAEDIASILKEKANSLLTARGNVTVDKRTNTLLVQDIASKLVEIRALLKKLDIPIRQVEIATQIVTADNTLETALGIRFGGGINAGIGQRRVGVGGAIDRARGIADYTDATSGSSRVPPSNTDLTIPPPIVSSANTAVIATPVQQPPNANITQQIYNGPGPTVNNTEGLFTDLGALTAGTLFGAVGLSPAKVGLALAKLPNGTLLDLELQALEYTAHSKTLAKPKLVTMDQNKASIEQGVDIPYLQASSSGATSVAYKTAALKLEVTPQITPDDKVSLDLMISNDSQGSPVAAGPTINTHRLQTKVLVDNGETVVLGGVLQVINNKQMAKVPFFGDLPIIGPLFRNKYTRYSPTELIIFLTPKIIYPVITKQELYNSTPNHRVIECCED